MKVETELYGLFLHHLPLIKRNLDSILDTLVSTLASTSSADQIGNENNNNKSSQCASNSNWNDIRSHNSISSTIDSFKNKYGSVCLTRIIRTIDGWIAKANIQIRILVFSKHIYIISSFLYRIHHNKIDRILTRELDYFSYYLKII